MHERGLRLRATPAASGQASHGHWVRCDLRPRGRRYLDLGDRFCALARQWRCIGATERAARRPPTYRLVWSASLVVVVGVVVVLVSPLLSVKVCACLPISLSLAAAFHVLPKSLDIVLLLGGRSLRDITLSNAVPRGMAAPRGRRRIAIRT
jgi:hypothetical protein